MGVQQNLSVDQIRSNTVEGLTFWMNVQPTSSIDQSLERDSPSGWAFSQPNQLLGSGEKLESNSPLEWCSAKFFSSWDLVKHWRATHRLDGCSANLVVSLSGQVNYWRATHSLHRCFQPTLSLDWRATHLLDEFLVSKIHVHSASTSDLLSGPSEQISGYNDFYWGILHTYCQHSISQIHGHLT